MTRPTATYIVREGAFDVDIVDTRTDVIVKSYKRLGNAINKARELNRATASLEAEGLPVNPPKVRTLSEIAGEIDRTWKKPYFGAVPYLEAMRSIESVDDKYGWDSGDSIVRYFLANAGTWRGEDAKRIKAELKAMVK
ncbi:hypothetical protein SEA_DEKHOCKEY33_97 [Gordonia phage DekHockey33]|uniref:Uncharacterized protein n=1 Tax=Gordonia phage KatherineG TaxID=1838070 RepID=A0A166YEI6_9CAUD|nr:hypothetical protein BEN62_gp016 [Gordonia phage KatherineG]ANA87227.1 hypothetical protein PBI_KATHERINEG_94 [Gordonia phage KatherineG]QWS67876.1 hypothetical protein SEA_DEKHOCKEY33_97 [Gordonia phage DekHockey33]